jgi:hypothetical protein
MWKVGIVKSRHRNRLFSKFVRQLAYRIEDGADDVSTLGKRTFPGDRCPCIVVGRLFSIHL